MTGRDSQDSGASQRPAGIRMRTPMKQPGSKARRYRAAGTSARLIAYLWLAGGVW